VWLGGNQHILVPLPALANLARYIYHNYTILSSTLWVWLQCKSQRNFQLRRPCENCLGSQPGRPDALQAKSLFVELKYPRHVLPFPQRSAHFERASSPAQGSQDTSSADLWVMP
jgi:hypothetical protein